MLKNPEDRRVRRSRKLLKQSLLELMKDKSPGFYYSDILVEDGKTLNAFMNGR